MSRKPASQTPQPVKVDTVIFQQPVIGLRNPPCCGRACSPRLRRTRVIGASRVADGLCPLCGHLLRITYERRAGEWYPVSAADLTRVPPKANTPEPPQVQSPPDHAGECVDAT